MKSEALKPVLAVLFAALIFWIGFTFHSCRKAEDPAKTTYIKGAETTALIKGKDSIKVTPGEPDTVVKYVPYPVYVSAPAGIRHGSDSSSYNLTRKEGIVDVITFPATDSVRIEFLPMAPERIITRIDTVFRWRVDTLRKVS